MRQARSRNRSFTRGHVEALASELRAHIIGNDIKSFDEVIQTIQALDDTGMLLAGVLNFNFLDEPNHAFTAMQAATVTAISTGDTEILRQLIQLGADTSWDTSAYDCPNLRSLDHDALPTLTVYPDYRYRGSARSGDSVYESFERAIESRNMHETLYHQFSLLDVVAERNLDESLSAVLAISLPISVIQTIRGYTEIAGLEELLSQPHARGWMRDLREQSTSDSFAAQYNHEYPEAEAQGYGPGAMVVYKPK